VRRPGARARSICTAVAAVRFELLDADAGSYIAYRTWDFCGTTAFTGGTLDHTFPVDQHL
jgi:hypothetical protein